MGALWICAPGPFLQSIKTTFLFSYSLQTLCTLFSEVVKELETAKTRLLMRLDIWKRQQQLAGNGTYLDEDLDPLQKR